MVDSSLLKVKLYFVLFYIIFKLKSKPFLRAEKLIQLIHILGRMLECLDAEQVFPKPFG